MPDPSAVPIVSKEKATVLLRGVLKHLLSFHFTGRLSSRLRLPVCFCLVAMLRLPAFWDVMAKSSKEVAMYQ